MREDDARHEAVAGGADRAVDVEQQARRGHREVADAALIGGAARGWRDCDRNPDDRSRRIDQCPTASVPPRHSTAATKYGDEATLGKLRSGGPGHALQPGLMLRLVVLVLLVAIPAAAAPGLGAGPARVIDGATIDLAGERLRLIGIDA